ncbi:hypothetical protein GP486_007655 [Trichoglossum hirsutum]|uniref:Ketoreductase domain-containing protein n=1 Tax=Trichoglossum hirsutum TaxID=265104 RepID=A0A9P8I5Y9_9PEZI|nr:hypothetical protein GP486_007655 [Trichoglossum hirsutum]
MSYGEDLPTASSTLVGPVATGPDSEAVLSVLKVRENTDPADAVNDPRNPPRKSVPLNKTLAAMLPTALQKFLLYDKVVVVTGGARGLGFNMAQALGECGAKAIVIMDVLQEPGDGAAAELHEMCGVPVQFYKVDIRDEKGVAEVISNVAETFGSIDVLVNSAGIADSNLKAETYEPEKFRRLIDINVIGSFLVAQATARTMIKSGNGGSIVFVASMSGRIVNYPQEQSAYNASKAAVIQLGKSLAAEWAPYGIRVNCISPGYMDTALNRVPALDAQKKIWRDLTPQKRLGRVDELNNLAVFLASDASSFMTGADCIIDGGYSLW